MLSPEKLRSKEQELFEFTARGKGLNTNVFSSATDVIDMMKPGNGIKIISRKIEAGGGKYINSQPSKMSLKEYKKLANKNTSLASITLRGISEFHTLGEKDSMG